MYTTDNRWGDWPPAAWTCRGGWSNERQQPVDKQHLNAKLCKQVMLVIAVLPTPVEHQEVKCNKQNSQARGRILRTTRHMLATFHG
jgi:hypothetical protein